MRRKMRLRVSERQHFVALFLVDLLGETGRTPGLSLSSTFGDAYMADGGKITASIT